MHSIKTLTVSILLVTTLGSAAAQTPGGPSRDQVKAELAEARRAGNLSVGGEANLKLNDVYPQRYPARPAAAHKSRDVVKAELMEARRTGDIVFGEAGLTLYEQHPQRYPAREVIAGKSRDEVKAELAEARAVGDISIGEDGRTLAETFPQRYAAVRAQRAAEAQRLARQATARAATN